ncbi:MmcQ/YjbR family DNA-binding protein [Rhizobium rhizogenes]|uniref:MmcQ/YjbR family DNA-binding protein n=1 Tax=Rhizobium rhizogenes TaxID=359 RepID=UPI00226EE2ED|nr:MmcQ/YjbR family DNA-binding protein [Rhizobium rhizogenes]
MDPHSTMDAIFERLQQLAAQANLPCAEHGTHYGLPALKVGGKAFVTVKNNETIVLAIPIDRKEQLMEMAPEIYFQTDHYIGWPSLPLRITAIGDEELQQRLIEAWRYRAPKKLQAAFNEA